MVASGPCSQEYSGVAMIRPEAVVGHVGLGRVVIGMHCRMGLIIHAKITLFDAATLRPRTRPCCHRRRRRYGGGYPPGTTTTPGPPTAAPGPPTAAPGPTPAVAAPARPPGGVLELVRVRDVIGARTQFMSAFAVAVRLLMNKSKVGIGPRELAVEAVPLEQRAAVSVSAPARAEDRVAEGLSELEGHDVVEDWVDDGADVVEDSRREVEHVLQGHQR